MRKFIPIILLLIFSSQDFAQEYFPLQMGNKWNMPGEGRYCIGDSLSMVCPQVQLRDTILLQVIDDTLMAIGMTYTVLNFDFGFSKYIRADTSFIYFYDDTANVEVPVFNLRAELFTNDTVSFHNGAINYMISLGWNKEYDHLGEKTNSLIYLVANDKERESFSIMFSDKLGPVFYWPRYWEGNKSYQYNYLVTNCVINGVSYGNTIDSINLPLAVNNSWTFYGTGAECFYDESGEGICLLIDHRDTLTFTIQKDTVMSNNKTYFKIGAEFIDDPMFKLNEKLSEPAFIRADENYLYVYDSAIDSETALLNLTGTIFYDDTVFFGPKQETAYNVWISGMEEKTKFGFAVKTIFHYLFELDTMEFVGSDVYKLGISDNFGFTDFGQTYWFKTDDQLKPYQSYAFKYTLASCTIGGVVYSNQISVEPGEEPNAPKSFSLSQNYPNPFNPSTTIEFAVPKQTRVKLTVFDILGREISVLANDVYSAGNYKAMFNGSNLPSGVYLYRLETDSYSQTRKFILLK